MVADTTETDEILMTKIILKYTKTDKRERNTLKNKMEVVVICLRESYFII